MIKLWSEEVKGTDFKTGETIHGITFCANDGEKEYYINLTLEDSKNPKLIMQALLNLIMGVYDLDYIPMVEEIRSINND